jgi:FkbM family methyltransferase
MENLCKDLASKWEYLSAQEALRRMPLRTMSRLISWRARCFMRRGAIARLRRWDLDMRLPPNWRGVEKLIFAFRDHYEPELGYLEKILSPGMTFVDAGACYGIYALAASKLVGKEGRVLAFEPASRAFQVLEENIALNRLANVLAYRVALTEKKGKGWLYHHANVGCDSLGRDQSFTESGEEIATDTLDNFLRNLSLSRVDVIKMDVQGAEELVLRGASAIVKAQHPIVIFEVYPDGPPTLGLTPFGAWDWLKSLGYEFFVVDGSESPTQETSPPLNRNVIAIYRK